MIKKYRTVCFAPDDVGISSPELSGEDLQDFVDIISEPAAEPSGEEASSAPAEGGEGTSEESTTATEAPSDTTPEGTGGTGEGTETVVTLPMEPAPVETSEPSEVDVLRTQIEKLTAMVNQLSVPKEAAPATTTTEVKAGEKTKTVQELAETIDFDYIMDNKENFVAFLLDFATTLKSEAAQTTLQAMPRVVGSVVQRQTTLNDIAREFYGKNKDLLPVKAYVGRVANEISAANPDFSINQVLEEAAKQARTTLGLIQAAQKTEKKAAALPGATGVRSQSVKPIGLQKEIEDFITD